MTGSRIDQGLVNGIVEFVLHEHPIDIEKLRRSLHHQVIIELILGAYVQTESITTKVMSSNPLNGRVYSIQLYVIKFVSDLRQSVVFSRYSDFLHQ